MRVLSEEEFDSVFGGDGTVGTTLSEITVTASYSTFNASSYFYYGPDYSESGNGSGGSAPASAYYALPPSSLPSTAKLKCVTSAAAVPGHGPVDGYDVLIVNSHGYKYLDPATGQDTLTRQFRSDSYQPPGWVQMRGEIWVNPASSQPNGAWNAGRVNIYADAMVAIPGNVTSHSYYNDAGDLQQVGKSLGPLTAEENAMMVAAHEYQHAYQFLNPTYLNGRDKEADAETFAIKALERYRAGNKGNCN